jgi:hypothetical protein
MGIMTRVPTIEMIPHNARHRVSMHEHDRWGSYGDPDRSPWTALALGVVLTLVCLILIARFALALLAG